MVHGGNEYNPIPSPRMIKTYRSFADAGASIVIGTHPHVPQGFEIYRDVPIFYSIGNFVFDLPNDSPLWSKSYAVRAIFTNNIPEEIHVIPYKTVQERCRLTLLKGNELDRFLDYLTFLTDVISHEDEATRYWNGWCALNGPEWAGRLIRPRIPWKSRSQLQKFLATRNLLTCEAHHELLCTYLDLVRKRRIGEAKKYIGRIRTLQKGNIPK